MKKCKYLFRPSGEFVGKFNPNTGKICHKLGYTPNPGEVFVLENKRGAKKMLRLHYNPKIYDKQETSKEIIEL